MRLFDIRNELKLKHNEVIIFMKYGNFYRVFDDDTYIISGLLGYKIYENKVGFPISEYKKVRKILDKNCISYIFYNDVEEIKENNNYELYLDYFKRKFYQKEILKVLDNYNVTEELEKILKVINYSKLVELKDKYEK